MLTNIKKFIIPVLILIFIIASIGVTLFLVKQRQELRKNAAPATVLSLKSVKTSVSVNEEFNVDVEMATGANVVAAAEVHIRYDPQIFQGISFTKGAILTTELIAGSVSAGSADITLGNTIAYTGTGVIATLKLKALKAVSSSQISFEQSTAVASGASTDSGNILSSTNPLSIGVNGANTQATATPTPTGSNTLATATPTPTGSRTPTPTGSLTPTVTPTGTRTPTPTGSRTPTPTTPPLGGTTQTPSPTPTSSGGGTGTSTDLTVTSPSDGENVTSSLPTISGKATPNAKIVITIQSDPQTITTYADASGNWSIKPDVPLDTGSHTLIATASGSGTTQTKTVSFTIGTLPVTATTEQTILMLGAGALFLIFGVVALAL